MPEQFLPFDGPTSDAGATPLRFRRRVVFAFAAETRTLEELRRQGALVPPEIGPLTSSAAATPAKKTATQELHQERERRETALNSSALLKSFARALYCAKTPPEAEPTLPGLGNDSEMPLRALAILSCPSDSAPVALGLTISGTGCSCSPKIPTPSASLFGCKDVEKLKTRRERCREKHGNGNGFGLTLGQWAALNGVELTPEMVEAMMGFPPGWTDCACSETPSIRD